VKDSISTSSMETRNTENDRINQNSSISFIINDSNSFNRRITRSPSERTINTNTNLDNYARLENGVMYVMNSRVAIAEDTDDWRAERRQIRNSETQDERDRERNQAIALDEAMGRAMELMAIQAIENEAVRVSQRSSNSNEQNSSSNTNIQDGIIVANVIAYVDSVRNIFISAHNNLSQINLNNNIPVLPVIGTRVEEQYIYS